MTVVCLYEGMPGECQNCGGSTSAEGGSWVGGLTGQWVPDGTRGPFPGDERFCSEDCFEDHHEFVARQDEIRRAWFACCPDCGFDRQEHDEGCPRAAA